MRKIVSETIGVSSKKKADYLIYPFLNAAHRFFRIELSRVHEAINLWAFNSATFPFHYTKNWFA